MSNWVNNGATDGGFVHNGSEDNRATGGMVNNNGRTSCWASFSPMGRKILVGVIVLVVVIVVAVPTAVVTHFQAQSQANQPKPGSGQWWLVNALKHI